MARLLVAAEFRCRIHPTRVKQLTSSKSRLVETRRDKTFFSYTQKCYLLLGNNFKHLLLSLLVVMKNFSFSVSGMRILVMLLLDTLPMLGNVLLLCFFVFFIFGIVGVQLWEGILRQRCYLKQLPNISYPE